MRTLNSVNERLDYLIEKKKMSDAKFMRETKTNNIGKMRSGKLSVTEGTISRICKSLGVSYDWLKYGIGEMYSSDNDKLRCSYENEEVIREAARKQMDIKSPALDMVAHMMFNNVDNIQHVSTGSDRANNDRIKSLEDKNEQLIRIINAKDEIIRFLKALLKSNKIDY